MGWFSKTPATPQQQIDELKVDHLPEELRPQKPDLDALGLSDIKTAKDLKNQLQAHQQNVGKDQKFERG